MVVLGPAKPELRSAGALRLELRLPGTSLPACGLWMVDRVELVGLVMGSVEVVEEEAAKRC